MSFVVCAISEMYLCCYSIKKAYFVKSRDMPRGRQIRIRVGPYRPVIRVDGAMVVGGWREILARKILGAACCDFFAVVTSQNIYCICFVDLRN